MSKIIVAIDGFSSSGKSTVAKMLAAYAGYVYVDTGAMYRAVALFALENGLITETEIFEAKLKSLISKAVITFEKDKNGKQYTCLNGQNIENKIRTLDTGNAASRISTIGFVRQELVRQQQLMGRQKGIVMDGRDIGSVVFPSAELKIFVTADVKIRAERRYRELLANGQKIDIQEVLHNLMERDYRDTHRNESPLIQMDDANLLDNSKLSLEEQQKIVCQWFDKKIGIAN
jgi:cytidylate kinase